jgi:hypothetical protein
MTEKIRGSCLCGEIQLVMDDDFDYAGYCHCSECQKFSGSANSAFGGIEKSKVDVVSGAEFITYYEKYAGSRVAFCRQCGSCLLNEKVGWDTTNIRLGILDDRPGKEPDFHVYVASKAPWHHWQDDLKKYEELPG